MPATKKTSAKKVSKKPVKKPAPKHAAKKISIKHAGKKPVKKPAPKPAKHAAKKPVKKPAAKHAAAKKPVFKKPAPKAPEKKPLPKPVVKKETPKPEKIKKPAKPPMKPAAPKEPLKFRSIPLPTYKDPNADTIPVVVTKKVTQIELTKEEIAEIKTSLTLLRDEVVKRIAEKKSLDMPEAEVGDPIDVATQSLDKEILFEVTDNDHIVVDQIEAALRRIELGSYGICEACRCIIPKKRVKAMPFARYCINCQTSTEAAPVGTIE